MPQELKDRMYPDNKPIYFIKHLQLTPLWKRIWHIIFRPRLSNRALEKVNKQYDKHTRQNKIS